MTPFDTAIAFTLREEGGFSDDPHDPGGPTNYGVTLATLTHWRGLACVADDVRLITLAETDAIYRSLYWHALRCDLLPPGVEIMTFDFGVNAGPHESAVELQQAVGASVDGVVGPLTALAARGADRATLIGNLHDLHEARYRSRPGFARYGHGWLARLARCTDLAVQLAATN